MAKPKTSELKKTTISMQAKLYEKALARSKKLKYSNFSEYLQFLLEDDIANGGEHITVRGSFGKRSYLRAAEEPGEYKATHQKKSPDQLSA